MKITEPRKGILNKGQLISDLEAFIAQPDPTELPPCPRCPQHAKLECSPVCGNAPAALSEDGVRYPIELKVIPIVYELSSTRLMQTCWSCEGHMNHEGELWKLPQVSFYSYSPVYPQLLLRHVGNLKRSKSLSYAWKIVLCDYGQEAVGVTYTMEPDISCTATPHLGMLQNDLQVISRDMRNQLIKEAKLFIKQLSKIDGL